MHFKTCGFFVYIKLLYSQKSETLPSVFFPREPLAAGHPIAQKPKQLHDANRLGMIVESVEIERRYSIAGKGFQSDTIVTDRNIAFLRSSFRKSD